MYCLEAASAALIIFVSSTALWIFLGKLSSASRATYCTMAEWSSVLRSGQRVLVLSGNAASKRLLTAWVRAAGAVVSVADCPEEGFTKSSFLAAGASGPRRFDVVIVDGVLDGLPEERLRTALARACAQLTPNGVLLLQGRAALPLNVLACLLQGPAKLLDSILRKLMGGAWTCRSRPNDLVACLPEDTMLESRRAAGPLNETLCVRKMAGAPGPALERLRRLYGNTSMDFCTSSAANRIGAAEEAIRYFVAVVERDDGAEEVGYFAYVELVVLQVRLRLVLMDPICAPGDRATTLRCFLENCGFGYPVCRKNLTCLAACRSRLVNNRCRS